MKRSNFLRVTAPTLIVATAMLGGCGWFHRDHVDYYKGTQETRPLEVPPDLDKPSTARNLVVPGATGAPSKAAGADAIAPPSAAGFAADASDLHIADTLDNTYQRVGLALDHAQLGKVASKDDAAHSYVYDFDGAVASAPAQEHHWYSRVLHPFGGDKAQTRSVKSSLRVNVSEDAGGARISVVPASGDTSGQAAATRLLSALRERLS